MSMTRMVPQRVAGRPGPSPRFDGLLERAHGRASGPHQRTGTQAGRLRSCRLTEPARSTRSSAAGRASSSGPVTPSPRVCGRPAGARRRPRSRGSADRLRRSERSTNSGTSTRASSAPSSRRSISSGRRSSAAVAVASTRRRPGSAMCSRTWGGSPTPERRFRYRDALPAPRKSMRQVPSSVRRTRIGGRARGTGRSSLMNLDSRTHDGARAMPWR